MSTTTNTSTENATCIGCGKAFKGARGLKAHQNSAFASLACKPYLDNAIPLDTPEAYAKAAEVQGLVAPLAGAKLDDDLVPTSVGTMVGGETTYEEVDAKKADLDGVTIAGEFEPTEEFLAKMAECDEATADLPDEDEPADTTAIETATIEVRDEVIKEARRYARVPEFPTTLVHLTGVEEFATPTAWRWHPEDAKKLMDTAFSSSVVRITKHDEGRKGETVVTDFQWLDGLRARVTEKFSI